MATQKIHFFTGKGGVGKSTLAASFAYEIARNSASSNILLTELSERPFYQDFLQVPTQGYTPVRIEKLSKNLALSLWSPQECLREYALHLLKIESLYKLFFENPVSRSLIQVAPGLQELAILGKVTSSVRQHGPAMNFDQIVIDAYSTGHFLSLLRAPKAMSEVIQFGPMGEQSKSIDRWIRNPDFCQIHLVCLPELFPVTETIELYQQLVQEFGLVPKVYLNKYLDLNISDLQDLSESTQNYFKNTIHIQNESVDLLKRSNVHFQKMKLQPTLDSLQLVDEISTQLESGLV